MYKKKLCVLLAVVMASTSFAGCAKNADDEAEYDAKEIIETLDPKDVSAEESSEEAVAESDTDAAAFDASVYESLDYNMEAFSSSVKLTTKGYYGNVAVQAKENTMYMSIEYDLPHLAELSSSGTTENAGTLIELYSADDGKFYMNDMATDVNTPKRIYFDESKDESTEETGMTAEVEESFSLKKMFGEETRYLGYSGDTVMDGKTVDICDISLKSESGNIIPCKAYIDRDTKTLLKIEKEASGEKSYSMVIEPMNDPVEKPSWVDECVKASDEDAFSLIGIILLMGQLVSEDGENPIFSGGTSSPSIPEVQKDMMEEKLHDSSYWEEKIGSYSGYSSLNGMVTVYDANEGEHYFVWDSDAMDFVETDENFSTGDIQTSLQATSASQAVSEPSAIKESRTDKNTKEQAAKATTMDEKRKSFAYWKTKIGGYTGQSSNETGTSVTVYDANGFSHSFTWNESLGDYVEH